MEIGALKRSDYEVWVKFCDDAEVLVRYLSMQELKDISLRATKRSWDRKHKPVEEVDAFEANRLIGRAAVRGWKGITMEGEEFPYTEENCDFLMTRWAEFSRFVGDACMDLQGLVDAERTRAEGNSAPGSGPGGTSLG